eukprot:jgi/Chlat1/5672/Chrsp37S05470
MKGVLRRKSAVAARSLYALYGQGAAAKGKAAVGGAPSSEPGDQACYATDEYDAYLQAQAFAAEEYGLAEWHYQAQQYNQWQEQQQQQQYQYHVQLPPPPPGPPLPPPFPNYPQQQYQQQLPPAYPHLQAYPQQVQQPPLPRQQPPRAPSPPVDRWPSRQVLQLSRSCSLFDPGCCSWFFVQTLDLAAPAVTASAKVLQETKPRKSPLTDTNGAAQSSSVHAEDRSVPFEEPAVASPRPLSLPSCSNRWSYPDNITTRLRVPEGWWAQVEALEELVGLRFAEKELLMRALVHESYYNRHMPRQLELPADMDIEGQSTGVAGHHDGTVDSQPKGNSQDVASMFAQLHNGDDQAELVPRDAHAEHTLIRRQLEQVGDALLNLVAVDYFTRARPRLQIGQLTIMKSHMRSNRALAQVGRGPMDLMHVVLAAQFRCRYDASVTSLADVGWDSKGVDNILADCIETILGAIYAYKGAAVACQFCEDKLLPWLEQCALTGKVNDPISQINTRISKRYKEMPVFRLINQQQMEGNKSMFTVELRIQNRQLSLGHGQSASLARRDAAERALMCVA